jgi:hypothetical protein
VATATFCRRRRRCSFGARGCRSDPASLAELNEVLAALAESPRQRVSLADVARQLRERANTDRREVRHAHSERPREQLRAQSTRRDTQAAALEAVIAKLSADETALHRKESTIRERMLDA